MIILRVLAGLVVAVVLAVVALLVAARFADGPLGPVAGGPFAYESLRQGPEPDWNDIRDRDTVEFQLLDPPRSRTTWILVHGGRIYIPCGYMDTGWGRLWKQWPIEAERDGRALFRVDDAVYPRQLQRISSGPLLEPLIAELNRKYQVGATVAAVTSGSLWLFELAPGSQAASVDGAGSG